MGKCIGILTSGGDTHSIRTRQVTSYPFRNSMCHIYKKRDVGYHGSRER